MENGNLINKKNDKLYVVRWVMVAAVFALYAMLLIMPGMSRLTKPVGAMMIAVFAFMHGFKRYGIKNMIVFFVITWVISNFFESLSIAMGFPFGNYFYDLLPGPRIVNVPILIMPSYFGMCYLSLIISSVLTGQYGKKLNGSLKFFVPLLAAFIMVMWDLVMDPGASTITGAWVWKDGGAYFGVPISNFAGWFFVVYLIMQAFTLYLSKFDKKSIEVSYGKPFYLQAVILYGVQGLSYLIPPIIDKSHLEIDSSMALVSVFTMIFVAIAACVSLLTTKSSEQV